MRGQDPNALLFLPTPSVRRATFRSAFCRRQTGFISTHALREEGDTS
mgnify:CR=1 FL=1